MLVSVDPASYYAAAVCFGKDVAGDVQRAEATLASALAGTERIAGSDEAGSAWAAEYDRVAGATSQTINDAARAALTVADLLRQSGLNHAMADADSHLFGAVLQAPTAARSSGFGSCVQVPSPAGGFIPAPEGWEQVAAFVAIVWPDGDASKLRGVAEAWRSVANSLEGVWPSINRALTALDGMQSPEIDSARGVCLTVGDALTETAGQCRAIAEATDSLAAHIEEAQGKLREQVAIMLAETALIEAAAVAAGVFTAGVGLAAGTAGAVLNTGKFSARMTAIVLRMREGVTLALTRMTVRSLDTTTDSLRSIIARAPMTAATVGLAGTAKSLTAIADRLAKSPWPFGPSPRGFMIEARLGGNLPKSFPTIDRFDRGIGRATSIKSLDLGAKTYQSETAMTRLLTKYVDKVAEFKGANWGGERIAPRAVKERELHLAIPRRATDMQTDVLASMARYAESRGVIFTVEVIR